MRGSRSLNGRRREVELAVVNATVLLLLAITRVRFFTGANLADIFLSSMPIVLTALGMTLVILTGHIDISVGSIFAVCSVLAGVTARAGTSALGCVGVACAAGALMGAINGALTGYLELPSIVVTLATMVALRDGLRWETQGAWIGNLPPNFQRLGLGETAFTLAVLLITVLVA